MSNRNLQAKFDEFRQKIELTKKQRSKIKKTHRHLCQHVLPELGYVKESFFTGSYKKKTMIFPPNDVDIFVIIDDDIANIRPYRILGELKYGLRSAYPDVFIKRHKPCIVLEFKHCKFELTPAIRNQKDFYIPRNGANRWKLVEDPKNLETRLSDANEKLNGQLTTLIKIMKKCRNYRHRQTPKSFQMEEIAIHTISQIDSYRDGVQQLLRAYNWRDRNRSYECIEELSDCGFANYARNSLFGSEFPK